VRFTAPSRARATWAPRVSDGRRKCEVDDSAPVRVCQVRPCAADNP
jgi:hypothetical protein